MSAPRIASFHDDRYRMRLSREWRHYGTVFQQPANTRKNDMLHSIISWDCAFRSFFHLVPALAEQNFPKEEFELIYVQQRPKNYADKAAHSLGLQSLSDLEKKYTGFINFRVIYLDMPLERPYHLGICNNAGLSEAKGEYISVMDGDLLLSNNFLQRLTDFHMTDMKVVNLYRKMCNYPVGVSRFSDWKDARISYRECVKASKSRYNIPPKVYSNKGPLISAHNSLWRQTNGYTEDDIWATSASMAGGDVNTRLEIAAEKQSEALPNISCVHPWHPTGYARRARSSNKNELVKNYFSIQKELVDFSINNNIADVCKRKNKLNEIKKRNCVQDLVKKIHQEEKLESETGEISISSSRVNMMAVKTNVYIHNTKTRMKLLLKGLIQ